MTEMARRAALRAAFVAALALAMVAALMPAPAAPALLEGQDKLGHFVAFVALGLLGLGAWPGRVAAVVVGLLVYGYAIELAQSLTDHRHGDVGDWVADGLGVGTALVIRQFWQKSKKRAAD